MTSFVQVDLPSDHPGVIRAERAVRSFKYLTRGFDGSRGAATLLLAAVVSALLVVANQVIDTWSEGHLLAAWIVMWTVAFAALAIFAAPARQIALGLRHTLNRWAADRREAAADERLWQVALQDARVMADIQRSMNLSARAQRKMRSWY